MFKRLKNLFKKKTKNTISDFSDFNEIDFKDVALQNISIKIVPDGNNTALCLTEAVNNYKIVLDKEKALLLSIILNEYYNRESFKNISNIFNNESEE